MGLNRRCAIRACGKRWRTCRWRYVHRPQRREAMAGDNGGHATSGRFPDPRDGSNDVWLCTHWLLCRLLQRCRLLARRRDLSHSPSTRPPCVDCAQHPHAAVLVCMCQVAHVIVSPHRETVREDERKPNHWLDQPAVATVNADAVLQQELQQSHVLDRWSCVGRIG